VSEAPVKEQMSAPRSEMAPGGCSRRRSIVDELCRCAKALEAVSEGVRGGMEQNQPEKVRLLREKFDTVRDDIVRNVLILAQHCADHGC
jgi:hypothetical protein